MEIIGKHISINSDLWRNRQQGSVDNGPNGKAIYDDNKSIAFIVALTIRSDSCNCELPGCVYWSNNLDRTISAFNTAAAFNRAFVETNSILFYLNGIHL